MMSENPKRSGFKRKILPHLEVLLQISLGMTKNGCDATRLMREAVAEAYQAWDESMPDEGCYIRINEIMSRRFINGIQPHSHPLVLLRDDTVDEALVKNHRLSPATATNARQNSIPFGASEDLVKFLIAITSLPAVYQPTMIRPYFKGFHYAEIAELADFRPHAIESPLNWGRKLIRKELSAHLMGNSGLDTVAELENTR
jgi:DNA-directed RNA polymerase specialized sigma24 family protein